jgi:Family of unknown function (DUF6223)
MLEIMKATFIVCLVTAGALALLGVLAYSVLSVAGVSVPATTTVHGLTPRRAWATASAGLALLAAAIGGLAHVRLTERLDSPSGSRAMIGVGLGSVAALSGGLNVALARGGPGSGNGVVGGALALILGLVAVALGAVAFGRRSAGRTTR